MRSTYREKCTNYCSSHYELLQEHRCRSIDDYIINSRMESICSWGTDLEIFLSAQILKTDIFIYRDCYHNWSKFSGYGFSDKQDLHELTDKRTYLRLNIDHYQPVIKVDSATSCNKSK